MKNRNNIFVIIIFLIWAIPMESKAQVTIGPAEHLIAEVYGSHVSAMSYEQLSWLNSCLERCEIIPLSMIETGMEIQNLNEVPLLDKYSEESIVEDTGEDLLAVNPLKYMINFFLEKDQFFRIADSEFVLKVNKKL